MHPTEMSFKVIDRAVIGLLDPEGFADVKGSGGLASGDHRRWGQARHLAGGEGRHGCHTASEAIGEDR